MGGADEGGKVVQGKIRGMDIGYVSIWEWEMLGRRAAIDLMGATLSRMTYLCGGGGGVGLQWQSRARGDAE